MNFKDYCEEIRLKTDKKCRGCNICNGLGCLGEVPGMGGKGSSSTFINNYKSWNEIEIEGEELPLLGVAPMTGVKQNMGDPFPEAEFHDYIVRGAKKAGILSCIGDGTPDFKLQDGAQALRQNSVKGVVFIKPYTNDKILERILWVDDVAQVVGVDIDSHKIDTMAGLAKLEKKSISQLLELKSSFKKPFALKGIESLEDLELVKAVKPDIVVVSNHGGRLIDHQQGIAYRLQTLMPLLKDFCGEVWVDGGLRTLSHFKKAKAIGASRVLIGRPFIQATAVLKEEGVPYWLKQLK